MTVAPPRSPAARLRRPLPPPAPPGAGASVPVPPADRSWAPMLAACVALAALSLMLPGAPTYDPMSWIVWGREIAHGALETAQGPSWKPLPVFFTTPFSLVGDGAAPELWLVVARAGGLLGVAMAFRLATRLAGWPAGVIAALAVLASEGYVFHAWRGNSEGLLVGVVLWAVERHLDGRRTWAFALGFAAALLRPEVWPMWGLYGLWLAYREPGRRPLVAALAVGVPVAWFLPEHLGSGDFLRAANRALQPNLDSPAYAAFPAWEVLKQSFGIVPLVVAAGALAAVATALRRRAGDHDHVVLVLAVSAGALLLAVAAMTQVGFSGNLRYVVLPVAFIGVLAGAGWVEAVKAAARLHRTAGPLLAALVAVAGVLATTRHVRDTEWPEWEAQVAAVERESANAHDLPRLVEAAGGPAVINRCPVYATRYVVPVVAWTLHRHIDDVDIFPLRPAVTIAPRGTALARDPRFPTYAGTERWVAGRDCRAQ